MRTSRRILFSALIIGLLGLLVPQSTLAQRKGGGKPDGGGDDGGGGTALPNVRYRVKYPSLPDNSTGGVHINDTNNHGQVVGWYGTWNGRRAFLYDPAISADQAIDLNTLVTDGIPTGWRVASGVAINEWMVAVGYIVNNENANLRRPIAIDLAEENPVVDLLPDLGADESYAYQLNENGDMLTTDLNFDDGWKVWGFNPGLYGNPLDRPARDGTPIDMSGDLPEVLALSGQPVSFKLNNPTADRPAQIAGVDADGVAFRYTLGDSAPERFPELNLRNAWLGGLNDAGAFTALLSVPKYKKRQAYTAPFRFNTSLDELPPLFQEPQAINSSGDVLFYDMIYRDDWQNFGYVGLRDLTVGAEEDLALWTHPDAVIDCSDMNDRAGVTDSGQIVGRLGGVFEFDILFVLTPEPAP